MKNNFLVFVVVFFCSIVTLAAGLPDDCPHFFFGCPKGTPESNDLVIRSIYALSSNDNTKFADWVAYRLDKSTVTGESVSKRNWKADPLIAAAETLEPEDYEGAWATIGTDRGHMAPLASFKGTDFWYETNYLSNITPQKSALNRGAWKSLEGWVRDLVNQVGVVYVITGTLYEKDMPSLPGADEPHKIPSGYWKIAITQNPEDSNDIRTSSFILSQDVPSGSDFNKYVVSVNEIEKRSGLDFMWKLPDDIEEQIESKDSNQHNSDTYLTSSDSAIVEMVNSGTSLEVEPVKTIEKPDCESEKTHWLNTKSNTRHNSSCRWYRNTKNGRMCGPNEGTACKQCGG
ncbi:DNA/RNA non-specific endonuclease [bacterium]|nr:DNA/RNA non-specific endonuclease [bacterium]